MSCRCVETRNNTKHNESKTITSNKTHRTFRSSSIQLMPRASRTYNEEIHPTIIALKPRKDAFGNSILKGSKKHRVSFIDKVETKKDLVEYSEFKENESIVPKKKIKTDVYHINIREGSYRPRRSSSFDLDSIQRENKSYNKDKVNCELCIVF